MASFFRDLKNGGTTDKWEPPDSNEAQAFWEMEDRTQERCKMATNGNE